MQPTTLGHCCFILCVVSLPLASCFLDSPSALVTVHEGQQATLKCSLTSRIPTWTRPSGGAINSHDFPTSQLSYVPLHDKNRIVVKQNGDLVINYTRRTDKGNYECEYPGSGSQKVGLVVLEPLSTTTKSPALTTECCICNDNDSDPINHCSSPNICDRSFHRCEYCETERVYTGHDWKILRRCGSKANCYTNLYHTATEPGCQTRPKRGTTCYTCCGRQSIHDLPFYCRINPDANVGFSLTTTSIPSTTMSFPATTTVTHRSVTSTITSKTSLNSHAQPPASTSTDNIVSSVYVQKGQQTTLRCSVTTKIPTWTDPYNVIINFHDFRIITPFVSPHTKNRMLIKLTGDLVINDTRLTDSGKYVCAYPGIGSETIRLMVEERTTIGSTKETLFPNATLKTTMTSTPSLNTIPATVTSVYVNEGHQAVLVCSITTDIPMWRGPQGGIINFQNSTDTNPFATHRDRMTVSKIGYLLINDTNIFDTGAYVCFSAGKGMATIHLIIGEISSTTQLPFNSTSDKISTSKLKSESSTLTQPTVSTTPPVTSTVVSTKSVYVNEGHQAVLVCSITTDIPMWTDPQGGIINFQDSTDINPFATQRDRITVSKNGYLLINDTNLFDTGAYVCFSAGKGMETIHLIIGVSTKGSTRQTATLKATIISTLSQKTTDQETTTLSSASNTVPETAVTVYVNEGHQAVLICSNTTDIPMWTGPQGGIINFQKSTDINPFSTHRDRITVSKNGYLLINDTKLFDMGTYVCFSAGKGMETIHLIIGEISSTAQLPLNSTTGKMSTPTLKSGSSTLTQPTVSTTPPVTSTVVSTMSATQPGTTMHKVINLSNKSTIFKFTTTTSGIDGGWSTWSSWTGCSPTCKGIQVRVRTCSNPFPKGGSTCPGRAYEDKICTLTNCILPYETRAPTSLGSTTQSTVTSPRQSSSASGRLLNSTSSATNSVTAVTAHSFNTTNLITTAVTNTSSSTVATVTAISGSSKTNVVFTNAPTSLKVTQFSTTKKYVSGHTNKTSSLMSFSSSLLTSRSLPPSIYQSSDGGFTKVSTTLLPKTTKKSYATIPPNPIKCAMCAGPPESCELAIYEDTCQPPNHYCINHISNLADGSRLVDRRCGNFSTCYNEWYLGSSDDDKCQQLSSATVFTYKFECTYCCIKNGCNIDLHPKEDTLYTNGRR